MTEPEITGQVDLDRFGTFSFIDFASQTVYLDTKAKSRKFNVEAEGAVVIRRGVIWYPCDKS